MRVLIIALVMCLFFAGPFVSLAENGKVYRYKSDRGRPAFTNMPDGLTSAEKETLQELDMSRFEAVLDLGHDYDLSRVALKSELAKKIEKNLSSTFAELRGSDYCEPGALDTEPSLFATAWRDHGPLVFIAGALALLFLFTPFALTKLGAPQWSRVLLYSTKGMLVLGILAYVFHRTGASVDDSRERHELCDQSRWSELQKDPSSLPERADLIARFKQRVEAIQTMRAAKIDGAVELYDESLER